jgi:hypothetical protein
MLCESKTRSHNTHKCNMQRDRVWQTVIISVYISAKVSASSRNHTPSQVPLAVQHNVGPTGPVITTIYTDRLLKNSTTHPKLIHRSTITSDPHVTTQTTVPPPKHRAWNVADRRENHTTYNTVQLHIQFRVPDDGQWWPETCRAFLAIKIVNVSHLVGHIFHFYNNNNVCVGLAIGTMGLRDLRIQLGSTYIFFIIYRKSEQIFPVDLWVPS